MKPEDITFAIHFGIGLKKIKAAAEAGEGLSLDADEAAALLKGIDLIRPRP